MAQLTVLVADDDRNLRHLIRVAISSEDVRLIEAADGDLAWHQVLAHRPNIAVLDIDMPGRSGLDVLRQIRRDATLSATHVILLSSHADPASIAAGRAAGADHYLTKPFSPRHLLQVVEGVVAELRARQEPDPIAFVPGPPRVETIVQLDGLDLQLDDTTPAEQQQVKAVVDFRTAWRESRRLTGELARAYEQTIMALAKAVETRDQYTGAHVERVRRYSTMIGRRLGLDPESLRMLEFGAVLHDVGKIGIPDAVLGKPGPLGRDEWAMMRRHPEIGRDLLAHIGFLAPALDAVATHHERWDGSGYPDGLRGETIPLPGRIVAVADTFDAMTTTRPYRAGRATSEALEEIVRGRGAGFDPRVADAFIDCEHELTAPLALNVGGAPSPSD